MDDIHFLQRLPERVSHVQMDLALELYRRPDLVRFLFQIVQPPPSFSAMAIALDHSPEPPWVVVAPNGKFITCLGAGMVPMGAYRLEKRRLDKLGEKYERLAVGTRYAETLLSEPRAFERLWHAIIRGGHRVTREAMVALLPMANLMAPQAMEQIKASFPAIIDVAKLELPRIIEREGRLRPPEETLLEAYWKDVWCIGHMLVLLGASERETVAGLGGDALVAALIGAGMWPGLWPVSLRTAWFAARAPGRTAVPELAGRLAAHAGHLLAGPSYAIALAFLGVAQHQVAREEVRRALGKCADFSEEDPAPARLTGGWARCLGEALAGPCDNRAGTRAAILGWRAGGGEDHRDERVRWANQLVCTWTHADLQDSLPGIIGWAARAPPENFYPTEAQRDLFVPQWSPALAYPWRRGLRPVLPLRAPVRYEQPKIGRNDPCVCASGKKFKKCCGA